MQRKLSAGSFFLLNLIWGAAFCSAAWGFKHVCSSTSGCLLLAHLISLPFAISMLAMMVYRLSDLGWPRYLVLPTGLAYVLVFGQDVLFAGAPLFREIASVLGIYSGALLVLIMIPRSKAGSGSPRF